MIVIDLQSSVTLEEQIRSGLRELIALGKLRDGDALPSVRQLAADLSVHWNTVARVYRRLQEEKLLVVGRGRGVFVRSSVPAISPVDDDARERLAGKLREVFTDARLLGLSAEEMQAFVLDQLKDWNSKENR